MNERPICHRGEDLVTYLYGEAGEADAKDFADHMRSCDACRSEFTIFQQVHDSILQWRNEALGAVSLAESAARTPSLPVTGFIGQRERLSGFAAVREFFNVSPLWLRGATALASLAFCLLVVFGVSRYWTKPDHRVYSPTEFQAAVNHEVEKRLTEINKSPSPTQPPDANTTARNKKQPRQVRKQNASGAQLARTRLTRKEREQLLADLRLLPGSDDEELPFILPNEPN